MSWFLAMSLLKTLQAVLDCGEISQPTRQAVSDLLRLQNRLDLDERRFATLGARVDGGLLAWDAARNLTYANDRMSVILGTTRTRLLGLSLEQLVWDIGAKEFQDFLAAARMGLAGSFPLGLRDEAGRRVPSRGAPFPLFDGQGTRLGAFALVTLGSCESGMAPRPSEQLLHQEELSHRENDILFRLVAGEALDEIATTCHISLHTVRNHIKAIYRKLGVHSRAELLQTIWERRGMR